MAPRRGGNSNRQGKRHNRRKETRGDWRGVEDNVRKHNKAKKRKRGPRKFPIEKENYKITVVISLHAERRLRQRTNKRVSCRELAHLALKWENGHKDVYLKEGGIKAKSGDVFDAIFIDHRAYNAPGTKRTIVTILATNK